MFDLEAHLVRQTVFSKATFGPGASTERVLGPRRSFVGVILHSLELHPGNIPECGPSIAAIRRFVQLGKAGKREKVPEYVAISVKICHWLRQLAPARITTSLTQL